MGELFLCIWYVEISFNLFFFSRISRYFINTVFNTWLGTIGCIWYISWVIVIRESPDQDNYTPKDELRYIQESLGTKEDSAVKHPWKDIFTSKAVYAISASHFAENWGFYTMLTQLPSFLSGKYCHIFQIICFFWIYYRILISCQHKCWLTHLEESVAFVSAAFSPFICLLFINKSERVEIMVCVAFELSTLLQSWISFWSRW